MESLLSIIIILASILLVFVVFIQNPKGGGLSSDFGSAQQLGGVQKTNEFIDKTTWGLAGLIAVLSVVLTIRMSSGIEAPQKNDDESNNPQTKGEAPAASTGTTEG